MSLAARCSALPLVARRLIALLIVPALLLLIALACYWPASEIHGAQRHWRAEVQELMTRAQHVPALKKSLEQELASLQHSPLLSKLYPASAALPTAAALQADIRALFNGVQVSGQSFAPIPPEESALFVRHGVRLMTSLRINQLQDLLTAVAAHPKFLQVGRLTVVSPQLQTADENPALAVTMEIYGYELRRDGAKRAVVAVTNEVRP